MNQPAHILHIANSADIAGLENGEPYRCASLDSEGFIHCCDRHQLAGVVGRYYSEIDNVHLLIIDVDSLTPALIHENTMGGDELFPHVYGPIERASIIQIIPFGLKSDERMGLYE